MKKTISVDIKKTGLWLDTDISYANVAGWDNRVTRTLKMSVIRQRDVSQKYPAVVWLSGGGWLNGDKQVYFCDLVPLAEKGFVIFGVEYRTSNEEKFPAQLEDVKAAIRYIKSHAEAYCVDPDRIGIMGGSAGGHLASLAGVTSQAKQFDKGDYLEYSSSVQAVCAQFPPIDFTKLSKSGSDHGLNSPDCLLIGEEVMQSVKVRETNPISYVDSSCPPFLLLHGSKDTIVPVSQSDLFYESLVKNQIDVDYYVIENAGHGSLEFIQEPVMNLVIDFFQKKLLK